MSARQSMDSFERKKSLDDAISTGATTPQVECAQDEPIQDEGKPNNLPNSQPVRTSTSQEKAAWKVDFEDGDPINPRNFKRSTKARITLQLGLLAAAASMGSSITSPAQDAISKYVHVDSEVTVLTVSLYVLGFAFGPSIWAPLSEMFGRRWSMLPAMVVLGIFSIGTAVSKNLASILVTRFFAGFFGCAPVSNVSAALGDMYAPKSRGTAVTFYAVCVVGGPALAPVIGAALTVNKKLGWRWTEYIEAIVVFFSVALNLFLLPELYAPVLLKRKAQRMRKETGDSRYWHPHEDLKLDFKSIVTKHFSRPVKMLLTEPMVTCIAIYASFVYGLLYMTLEVFPIVYLEHRHWPLVTSTLPFLGLLIGVICAIGINLGNQPRYARAVDANGGKPVPEARLAPMLVGGLLFAIGLFWFGWTANPKIFWLAPTIATAFIGAGFNVIFQQCINFLVDTYGMYAASATAANTLLRSFLAFAFPLVAKPMFHNLGVGPAMSLLGGIACLALPVPLIFMRFGPQLRRKSKFPID